MYYPSNNVFIFKNCAVNLNVPICLIFVIGSDLNDFLALGNPNPSMEQTIQILSVCGIINKYRFTITFTAIGYRPRRCHQSNVYINFMDLSILVVESSCVLKYGFNFFFIIFSQCCVYWHYKQDRCFPAEGPLPSVIAQNVCQ